MVPTSFRFISSSLLAFVLSVPGVQAQMIYKSATRQIHGSGTQLEAKEESSSDLTKFTADLLHDGYVRDEGNKIQGSVSAFASQTSSLGDNEVRGLARATGFGSAEEYYGLGRSTLSVEFELREAMRLSLSGQLRFVPHAGGWELNGSTAFVRILGAEGTSMEVLLDEAHQPDALGIIDFTKENGLADIFPAGSYVLEAFAEGRGSSGRNRCVDFDFTLTATQAVPEPNSSLAAILAIMVLSIIRRRRVAV